MWEDEYSRVRQRADEMMCRRKALETAMAAQKASDTTEQAPPFSETELQGMLFSRMRWKRHPFDRLLACKLNDSTVVVFLIKDGKALMIEDDINLYPTDALVTQLRLLSETK